MTERLQERMTEPSPALVADLRRLEGDLLVLGAGGKMGPSLVELAVRGLAEAGSTARVIAVSRFGDKAVARRLADVGAVVVEADLHDELDLAGLPDASDIVYLVGAKFGTTGNEPAMWTTNAYLPGRVARRFPGSRMAALSTANVYGFATAADGGPTEETPPAPVGEYAMSCLARERVLEHAAQAHAMPLALLRLCYAVEMRYGVLVDLARLVLNEEPIDISTANVNVVWQGYANEVTLRSLGHGSETALRLNVTGPETVSVRSLSEHMARRADRQARFVGEPEPTALLADAGRCHEMFGYPAVSLLELADHTVDWLLSGGEVLDKPTMFQRRDGTF